jgi:hypothetical protein
MQQVRWQARGCATQLEGSSDHADTVAVRLMARRRVDRLDRLRQHFRTVEARDERGANVKAAEVFAIPPARLMTGTRDRSAIK